MEKFDEDYFNGMKYMNNNVIIMLIVYNFGRR